MLFVNYSVATKKYFVLALVLGLITVLLLASLQSTYAAHTVGYEVWAIDQSDTVPDGGGTLYIYKGSSFTGRGYNGAPEVINFAETAENVGDGVGKRPHMILFNSEYTHAVISNVATGHIYIMDADAREIVASIRMGKDDDAMRGAHAAMPSPDGSMIVVTNHKKLEAIQTDYTNDEYTYNPDDALDLAALEDEGRPDNWIVCPIFTPDSRFVFVTLRGGGLYVIDVKSSPMSIVASFSKEQVRPNGCGGVHDSTGTKMYINSGGGRTNNPLIHDVYVFDLSELSGNEPTVPVPQHILSREGFVDSHGMLITKNDKYIWSGDRAANLIEVIDAETHEVVNQIDLTKRHPDMDPAPDLIFTSPHRTVAFASFRGPAPLTANVPDVNNAVGNSPGVGVIKMHLDGRTGTLLYVVPISNMVDGKETADPHGIAVREIR